MDANWVWTSSAGKSHEAGPVGAHGARGPREDAVNANGAGNSSAGAFVVTESVGAQGAGSAGEDSLDANRVWDLAWWQIPRGRAGECLGSRGCWEESCGRESRVAGIWV